MASNYTNSARNGANDDYISFSHDSSTPTSYRSTPFKSNRRPQTFYEQYSPHGSPQGFSSPIHNNRNFESNRRQSGHPYGDRFRGSQNYNRGNNWKNRNDNRKPYNNQSFNQSCNQSFNKSQSGTVNISDYFHPSMIQDPWKHLSKTKTTTNKSFEISNTETTDEEHKTIKN